MSTNHFEAVLNIKEWQNKREGPKLNIRKVNTFSQAVFFYFKV